MSYTVEHIKPQVNVLNQIIALGFDVVPKGKSARPYVEIFKTPQGVLSSFSEAQLLEWCQNIAESKGLHIAVAPSYSAVPPPVQRTESETRGLWMDQIDDTVEMVTRKFDRFTLEYELREAACHAYKDSGFTIVPDKLITHFADNVGMPYPYATEVILNQATQLRAAIPLLGNLRMDKYLIARAQTLSLADAEYRRIISAIMEINRNLP